MEAAHQRAEVRVAGSTGEHDLAVEDELLLRKGEEAFDQLREIARQRPVMPAAEVDPGAVAKREAPKAVPLRLVDVVALGQLASQPSQHGLDRWLDREAHAPGIPVGGSR